MLACQSISSVSSVPTLILPPVILRFEPALSDRKDVGVTRDQRTTLGNSMNHDQSQAFARRTMHPTLQYASFILQNVRVGSTVQLVDGTLIHVHDHCRLGLLFRMRTSPL